MRNWKYINGANVGNEGLSLWEKLKTAGKDHITMKSPSGEEAKINKDGDVTYKKDNKSQLVLDKHSSFEKAVEAYKAKGFKFGNSDGVARMFEGFVKDENKEVEKDSGSIEDLEKVGNIQFAGDYYDIVQENPEEFYIYLNGGARRYGPYRTKAAAEIELKKIIDRRNRIGNSSIYPWDQNKWREIVKNPKDYLPEEVEAAKKSLYRLEHKGKDSEKTDNSSSDDKFAYVMREFDEGKLKTPDGKVVTDPAQAKAIAYSESKKAENGLGRAFKAMNKGRINYDDDIVVIKKNGNILYKGMQDYANDDNIPWKYNEAKGIYEGPDGLTKEKIG